MTSEKPDHLYSDEISLTPNEDVEDYILLNLRKIQTHRRKFDIPVIGVAGSEGKTTTKRMLSAILSPKFNLLETPPNCSTTNGVTSTLLKLNEQHQLAILELGIVDPKQFKLAVKVAEPNIAAVTNIGEAHLATLGDKYLIADAKTELVRRLPKEGYAVLNMDDDLVSSLARYCPSPRVVKFGLNANSHFHASKIQYLGPDGVIFYVNGYYPFRLNIYGSSAIYNALTAISIARILQVEYDEIRDGLENRFSELPHRGNLIKHQDVYLLDHTYDATINSVSKACESLTQFKPFSKKLILVIGDIRNPGPKPRDTHLNMGYYIAALPIDTVITVGENARYVAEGIRRLNHTKKVLVSCRSSDELDEALPRYVEPQSTILFIGSKDLNLYEPLNNVFKIPA